MTLQALTPEWLASPEGKQWAKECQEARDKIWADAFNKIEIPLLDEVVIPRKQDRKGENDKITEHTFYSPFGYVDTFTGTKVEYDENFADLMDKHKKSLEGIYKISD